MVEGELRIDIYPECPMAEYWGTAAQLDAEGLIPANFEWPYSDAHALWERGFLEYRLHRVPPKDTACLRSQWVAMDNWRLRVQPHADIVQRHRPSAQGASSSSPGAVRMDWSRVGFQVAAQRDRSFRRLLEALLPPKKVRTKRAAAGERQEPGSEDR